MSNHRGPNQLLKNPAADQSQSFTSTSDFVIAQARKLYSEPGVERNWYLHQSSETLGLPVETPLVELVLPGLDNLRDRSETSDRFTSCYNRAMRTPAKAIGLATLVLLLWLPIANAQKEPSPDVPKVIQAPPREEVVLLAHASGSQIYSCQTGADNKFAWVLKAPDAALKDQEGKVIGSHFAGPSWKLTDGGEVTGRAAAHLDSPNADSIPWLLVNVVGRSGNGLLTNVTAIQRINTRGGKPPTGGCDQSHRNAETKSSYTADYYFYAPTKE